MPVPAVQRDLECSKKTFFRRGELSFIYEIAKKERERERERESEMASISSYARDTSFSRHATTHARTELFLERSEEGGMPGSNDHERRVKRGKQEKGVVVPLPG